MATLDDIWGDMDAALAAEGAASDSDDGSDDDAQLAVRASAARARICRLPNGDIHVCTRDCKFTLLNDDGMYVCQYTGLEYGCKCERSSVADTGRSTWSADPDNRSGAPVGGWRRKPNQMARSVAAYEMAHRIDDTEEVVDHAHNDAMDARAAASTGRSSNKRGALCVDVAADVADDASKRQRTCKREERDGFCGLHKEARVMLERLASTSKSIVASRTCPSKPPPVADARLLDEQGLFAAAVRKYVKQCTAKGTVPSMDDLHNLGLAVRAVVEQERAKQQAARDAAANSGAQLVNDVRFKTLAATLVVELWVAARRTPYFNHARRGTDSFRPFAAGALYAFKRGLTLPTGTLLVPPIPEFAAALPTARALNAADPAVRSLHSSSHRGLCSIHRCIASVPPEQAEAVFGRTLQISQQITQLTRARR